MSSRSQRRRVSAVRLERGFRACLFPGSDRRSPQSAGQARPRPALPDLSRHAARMIDEMAVATFVLDRDGRVAVWNDACASLTGLEAAKVIGTKDHWQGLLFGGAPVPRRPGARRRSRARVRRSTPHQGDGGRADRLQAKNWCDLPRGARVYLAIDANLIRDGDGGVIGVVETLQDQTASRKPKRRPPPSATHAAERLETVVDVARRRARRAGARAISWRASKRSCTTRPTGCGSTSTPPPRRCSRR